MAAFPTTVATNSDLYIAVNATSTQLTDNPLTIGATTVNVVDASLFPSVGFISIDNEIIKYTGTTGTSFTGCTRGADGTAAASHVQNSQVFHNVIAAHHNAPKDEIIATQQFISDLIGRENTHVQAPNGTVSAPSYTFEGDEDTGLYRSAANTLNAAIGGVITWATDSSGHNFYAGGSSIVEVRSAGLRTVDGTVGLPSHSFSSDTDTGLYRDSNGSFSAVCNGAIVMNWNFGSIIGRQVFTGVDGSAGVPALTFESDSNTGIYRVTTDTLGFTTGGTQRLSISTSAITAALTLAMGTNKITGLGNGTAAQDAAAYTQVKILQVVDATSVTSFASTSSTFVDTNLTATITPSSTSSRIIVLVSGLGVSVCPATEGYFTIARNGTNLGDTNLGFQGISFANYPANTSLRVPIAISHTDSPASTSAQTYTVQLRSTSGANNVTFGVGGARQSITLLEVNGI